MTKEEEKKNILDWLEPHLDFFLANKDKIECVTIRIHRETISACLDVDSKYFTTKQ